MKKLIISLVALSMFSLPCLQLQARHGHGGGVAAGVGIGLMTGAIVGSAASNSGKASRAQEDARRAQDEARIAQEKTEQLRREQTQDKIYGIQSQLVQKETSNTMNILIATIVLLFLGLLALGFVVLKRN